MALFVHLLIVLSFSCEFCYAASGIMCSRQSQSTERLRVVFYVCTQGCFINVHAGWLWLDVVPVLACLAEPILNTWNHVMVLGRCVLLSKNNFRPFLEL